MVTIIYIYNIRKHIVYILLFINNNIINYKILNLAKISLKNGDILSLKC